MKRILAFLLCLIAAPALAGNANWTVKDSAGATQTFDVTTLSSHFLSLFNICDWTTEFQCATVTAGNALRVDGSAVTQPVSAASLPLPSGASTSAKQPALGTAGTASADVLTVQGIASMTPLQQQGDTANGASDSGNPVKIGMVGRTSLPTAVADGQRINGMADKFGRFATVANGDRALITVAQVTVSSTTETTLLAAVASTFLDLVHISCTNNSASLVRVDIRDSTGGTVRFSRALAASGGGFVDDFSTPFPQSAVNNNWTIQLSSAVTDVRCDVEAFKNK